MKRFCFVAVLLLAAFALNLARADDTADKAEPGGAIPATGPSAISPDGKVWLRLHLAPGQVYAANLRLNETSKVDGAKSIEVKSKLQIAYFLHVLDADRDDNVRLRLTFSSILVEIQPLPGPAMILDTVHSSRNTFGKEAYRDPVFPFGLVEKSLMGQSVIVRLSPTAEVMGVEGLDELAARMPSSIPGLGNKRDVSNAISSYMRLIAFKGTASGWRGGGPKSSRMLLPSHLVGKGDTWESAATDGESSSSPPAYKEITEYRVDGREHGITTVGVKIYLKPGTGKTSNGDLHIWSNGSGIFSVNESSGWVLSGQFYTRVKTVLSHKANNKTFVDVTAYADSTDSYECIPLESPFNATPLNAAPPNTP